MDRGVSASNKISLFPGPCQSPTGGCPEGLVAPAERSEAERGDPFPCGRGPAFQAACQPAAGLRRDAGKPPHPGETPNGRPAKNPARKCGERGSTLAAVANPPPGSGDPHQEPTGPGAPLALGHPHTQGGDGGEGIAVTFQGPWGAARGSARLCREARRSRALRSTELIAVTSPISGKVQVRMYHCSGAGPLDTFMRPPLRGSRWPARPPPRSSPR